MSDKDKTQQKQVVPPGQVTPRSPNPLDGDDMTVDAPEVEDTAVFGNGQWVYCTQHLKPHETGWCGVGPRDKVGLGVSTAKEAYEKCRDFGFVIHGENNPPQEHTHLNTPKRLAEYIELEELCNAATAEVARLKAQLAEKQAAAKRYKQPALV